MALQSLRYESSQPGGAILKSETDPPSLANMTASCDEIQVYADVAERTGVQFERNEVRRSGGYCGSLAQLLRKARASGDGTFYLPSDRWPAETDRVEIRKPWVVVNA